MNTINIAAICKALGDSNRLQIVQMLSDGEKCGCKLLEAFEITQPTLSHHMKILCECGLVNARKEGKWQYYSLNCETLQGFKHFIETLSCVQNKDNCEEQIDNNCQRCSKNYVLTKIQEHSLFCR